MKPNPRRVSMIEKPQVVKLKLPDYLVIPNIARRFKNSLQPLRNF